MNTKNNSHEAEVAAPFKPCTIALVQMVSGHSMEENMRAAAEQTLACAAAGAELVILPEMFAVFGGGDQQAAGRNEATSDGPLRQQLAALARSAGVWLVAGSIPCTAANPYTGAEDLTERVYAACFVYDDQGQERSRYDKVHLFDANVNDAQGSYKESDTFAPGKEPVYFDSPWGRLGLAICYDLRFPEYFRLLSDAGCHAVLVPAAFTYQTGKAHWDLLLKARAVENQVYMLAAAQGGQHSARRQTWGHSCAIDPWGLKLDELETGEGHVLIKLDPERLEQCRRDLPVLQHRRIS